jgi:putative membrane protein
MRLTLISQWLSPRNPPVRVRMFSLFVFVSAQLYQPGFESWSFPPWAGFSLLLTALIYFLGWRKLRRLLPAYFPVWRLAAFETGLAALWVAVASPIEAFDDVVLTVHMVQHLLLMVVAPPFLLLGAPAIPLLRGLPHWVTRRLIGPFLSRPWLQRAGRNLTHPVVCWLAMALTMLGWHVPAAFEFALRYPAWHEVEHACFFLTSLMFWWPVIQPWPSRPHWPGWSVPLYLLFGDIVNTVLCALLAFSDRILYPSYAAAVNPFGLTPLADQVTAGALMWVAVSFVLLGAAAVITVRLLSPSPLLLIHEPRASS